MGGTVQVEFVVGIYTTDADRDRTDGQIAEVAAIASIFVNRAGRAQFALTVPSSAGLVADVAGRPFDDLVVRIAALLDR